MDGKQLKNSILQWAIQGKLVPQNPKDEPAQKLLERIAASRNEGDSCHPEQSAKGTKSKDLKKKKSVPSSRIYRENGVWYEQVGSAVPKDISDEIPFEIPESWAWCRFGNLVFNRDSERIPLSVDERKSLKKIYDYYGASGVIDKVDNYLFDKPLLLIGEDGANLINRSTPIAFIARGQYWVNNHAHVIDCLNEDLLQYVCTFINAISLVDYVTGTAQPKMNQEKMNSILVAVPPQAEQKRIVAKLEQVLPLAEEYGAAQEQLDKLNKELPEALKKSILQEAIQGKLVPQNPKDEPASVLLTKIRKEKEALVKQGLLKKNALEEVPIDEEEIPFEIPDTWAWCRLGEIGNTITGSTPSKLNSEYIGADIPFLSPGDISLSNKIISYDSQGLSLLGKSVARPVPPQTILQVCIGGSIGKCAIVDREVCFNQQINSITLKEIDYKYVYVVLQSKFFQDLMKSKSTGTATPIINKRAWDLLIFPLPPLAEQKRIVAKLEQLFKVL